MSSADRPYGATRIGTGVCYVIATALVEDKLFSGFPTFKFVMSGIPLYDVSKDSTNGGSGSHRYSNPATWGGDGDQLPAVQAYNVLRGIKYNGAWLYGLQNMAGAARLPAANWIAQIAKCRATITGEAGLEPTYRSGGQVNVNSQPANLLEALLTACQGRLCEIGGFLQNPSRRRRIARPSPGPTPICCRASNRPIGRSSRWRIRVNGIQGTYPSPAEGWETATAPPLYRTDLEVRDGNRRLMAAPQLRLRAVCRAGAAAAEIGAGGSAARAHPCAAVAAGLLGGRAGRRRFLVIISQRLYRQAVSRRQRGRPANLDCVFNVTEIDPADYDWDHAVDYTGVSTGPTVFARPPPQGVVDWYAEGTVLYDADGLGRRPAIRIAWDGSLPGVVGMQYEVRLTADLVTSPAAAPISWKPAR